MARYCVQALRTGPPELQGALYLPRASIFVPLQDKCTIHRRRDYGMPILRMVRLSACDAGMHSVYAVHCIFCATVEGQNYAHVPTLRTPLYLPAYVVPHCTGRSAAQLPNDS